MIRVKLEKTPLILYCLVRYLTKLIKATNTPNITAHHLPGMEIINSTLSMVKIAAIQGEFFKSLFIQPGIFT